MRTTRGADGRRATSDHGEGEGDQWLLIHKRDDARSPAGTPRTIPQSVKTGRTNDDVKAQRDAVWISQAPAAQAEIDLSRAVVQPMPDFIEPMLATLTDEPFSDPDWLFEIKWDGYRIEAVVDGRHGPAVDAQRQGRRDVLPGLPHAGDLDRCASRRSSTARSWRWTRTGGPTSACSRSGSASACRRAKAPSRAARLPGLRPALSRRPVAPPGPARGPQAAAAERARRAAKGALCDPRRRRRHRVLRGAAAERSTSRA